MERIANQTFGGERPLFESHHLELDHVTITDGESGIKECSDIHATDCLFIGRYPFWHVDGFSIDRCLFEPGARSALWYSRNLRMTDTEIRAPKMFREMEDIRLERVTITDADETFWRCNRMHITDLTLHDGTYPFMFCNDIYVDGLKSDSKYVFQYVRRAEIHNAHIVTKDAFWETEDVTIYDSWLEGEYLGWHSKRLRLVRCHIAGTQPLCYADDLVLEDCTFGDDADLCFEYSTVEARLLSPVMSIRNPTSGHITLPSVGEVIIDGNIRQPADCIITETDCKQ